MAADPTKINKHRFLFNIDILIEDETNGRALEKLLHLLNQSEIKDYRIQNGIELGSSIQKTLSEAVRRLPLDNLPRGYQKNAPASPSKDEDHSIWEQFQQFKQNNVLVRLTIVKPMGLKLSVPCRILNCDPASGNVSVYHVDEKQVYLFKINEIDDFTISS